jgi:predicted HicB family RNase H-like nuclease
MGRLAKDIEADLAALERGEAHVTESPLGDRDEPRQAARANGRILLRLSRQEHEALVREAAEQGVSLNHYLTEIVCARRRSDNTATAQRPAPLKNKSPVR